MGLFQKERRAEDDASKCDATERLTQLESRTSELARRVRRLEKDAELYLRAREREKQELLRQG